LYTHIPKTVVSRAVGIVQTNHRALVRNDEFFVGVFARASRVNHSCRPNAIENWDPRGPGTLSLRAIYDIREGDESTVAYRPATARLSKTERIQMLREDFGFLCTCPVCMIPVSATSASNHRRREIGVLND
jgi:hypothetical protein